ncbi:MAG: hemoglobin/transferrin/lactoferrin receptor protein [Alteromonadaceae bacterium]|jgi:hemoglobin/transferrin/lactoferrin receptor protein
MKIRYLSLIIAAVLSNQSLAKEIKELETTEVTAKKTNDFKVSAEDLNKIQVNDTKGTFSRIAGVTVSNSAPYSQKTYLRGVEEHSANVTIDGARQDGQLFHHSGNQMVDPAMLKSVSVELGASSVLSGYGANVGAIKYETVDPQDLLAPQQQFGFKTSTAMDTATEFKKLNLNAYGRLTDQLSALASLNWAESGDIETPDKDPIINKHSELKSGLIKFVYDFSEAEQLDFSAQRYDDGGHRAYSGEKPGATSLNEALGFNGYIRDTYTVNYHNNSDNPLLDLSVDAYFNEKKMTAGATSGENWYRDSKGEWHKDGTAETPEQYFTYKTVGLNVRNTFIINDIAWTAGIETFKSKQEIQSAGLKNVILTDGTVKSEDISVPNGPESTLFSTYVQGEFKFGALTVIPGIRYDAYSLGGAYDSSFNQLSPKLMVNWQANEDLIVKAGYGRIFKGPGLPETSAIQKEMQQSDDAKAETGNHFEFNVIQDLTSALNVDSASLYINLYQYTIDNSYHPTKNNTLTRGVYDLTMKGAEAGFKLSHQALTTYITYSYNTGENAYTDYSTDNFYSGTHVIKMGADYQVSNALLIGWDSNFSSDANLDNNSIDDGNLVTKKVKKSGYGVSNLWLDYQVAQVEGLSVKFAVENVFNKTYQNHNSFGMYWGNANYNDNEVGRNFKLAASYQF